ncbi:SlyX family protein [Thalassospira sp. MA62]|nr:SlyX family protein [Thalassospira sp. MA62]
MTQQDTDARITDLETRIAHMDNVVTDLSDMIRAQWDRIDVLERRNRNMSEDIKRLVDFLRTSPEDDAPPPHY